MSAASALLDRGYGKPVQQVETGAPGDFASMSDEELDAAIAENMAIINEYKRERH